MEKSTPKTKRETRTPQCLLVNDKIMEIKKATRKTPAYVKIAINDELAQRLFQNAMMGRWDMDFAVVGMRLEWIDVDYDEEK